MVAKPVTSHLVHFAGASPERRFAKPLPAVWGKPELAISCDECEERFEIAS
jgi:hypothetical protein